MLLDLLLGPPEDASSSPSFEGQTKPHAYIHMNLHKVLQAAGQRFQLQRVVVAAPKGKGCNGTRMTGPELDKYHRPRPSKVGDLTKTAPSQW